MPAITRSRLALLAVVVSVGGALPGCQTDDAIKKDAKDAQQGVDKGAGNLDEKAKGAADDAGNAIEKGVDDVDGR